MSDVRSELHAKIYMIIRKFGEPLPPSTGKQIYGFESFLLGKHVIVDNVAVAAMDGFFVAKIATPSGWKPVYDSYDYAHGETRNNPDESLARDIVIPALDRRMILELMADV